MPSWSERARTRVGRRARSALFLFFALVVTLWALAPRILAILYVDRVNLPRSASTTLPYREITFRSGDAVLSGWLFEPAARPRGLVVHLHGRMYTRVGGNATAEALVPRGYAVLTYDQRAHGASGGEHCTYGMLEKQDLARAIDAVGISPVYVVGHSLGAAVALQAAVIDPRIRAIVAASSYSDLRSALLERARSVGVLTEGQCAESVSRAEAKAGFRVDDVSPLAAAARLDIPVLLVHGTRDTATPPRHSERLLAALHGPKRLFLVEGAEHTDVLDSPTAPVWTEIARFLDEQAADAGAAPSPAPPP